MIKIGDIDIDVEDRDKVLKELPHIPAFRKDVNEKHFTGVYVQDIEVNPETGYATIDFKEEPDNIVKLDFINFNAIKKFISNRQIETLTNISPDWSKLQNAEYIGTLPHVHKWADFLIKRKVDSVDKLAMFLALIRPGKDHLKNKPWPEVEKDIWTETNSKYFFKKSHAYSYALTIVAIMNYDSGH